MADEPQETPAEEKGEAKPAAKSKLSFKTLILIGVPLVLAQILLAAWLVTSKFDKYLPEKKQKLEQKNTQETKGTSDIDLSKLKIYEVKDIIVNPSETAGQRYISVSANIYISPELEPIMKNIEPEIRSLIIDRISQKRLDELDDYNDKENLQRDIMTQLNVLIDKHFSSVFKDFRIPRVVFSNYTLQ